MAIVKASSYLSIGQYLVSNIVELAWLTRYPLPSKVIVDRGNEFSAEFETTVQANNT